MKPFLISAIISGISIIGLWFYFKYAIDTLYPRSFPDLRYLREPRFWLWKEIAKLSYLPHPLLLLTLVPGLSFSWAIYARFKKHISWRLIALFSTASGLLSVLLFAYLLYDLSFTTLWYDPEPFLDDRYILPFCAILGFFFVKLFPGLRISLPFEKPSQTDIVALIAPSVGFLLLSLFVTDVLNLHEHLYYRNLITATEKVLVQFIKLPGQVISLAIIVTAWQLYFGKMWVEGALKWEQKISQIGE